ncbi:MAG: hypothetical protein V7K89_24440 [Nostoc sp.]
MNVCHNCRAHSHSCI